MGLHCVGVYLVDPDFRSDVCREDEAAGREDGVAGEGSFRFPFSFPRLLASVFHTTTATDDRFVLQVTLCMLIGLFCGIVIFCQSHSRSPYFISTHLIERDGSRRLSFSASSELTISWFTDIVVFGKLICPGYDNANNSNEVGFHAGTNDYWVSVRGNVYDLTNFYRLQSDFSSLHASTFAESGLSIDILTSRRCQS